MLITSAPGSPKSWVQVGPARMRVRSKTRRPVSGAVMQWESSAAMRLSGLCRRRAKRSSAEAGVSHDEQHQQGQGDGGGQGLNGEAVGGQARSEEHTSELQSLMRTSY